MDPDDPPIEPTRTSRARAQAEHLRERATETMKDLESRRPRSRLIDAAFSTFERDVASGGGVLAAALAFRIFIFLVPFVFVIVTAVPVAAQAADADPTQLAKKFGMAGLAATAIRGAADMTFWNRLGLLLLGLFALVLASRSLVRVLRITHGLAWHAHVPRMKKPTRAALLLIVVVTGMVLLGAVTNTLHDKVGIVGFLPVLLTALSFGALWIFLLDRLPHQDVHWREQIPGAVLVVVGVEALQIATVVWFTRSIESKSETYGAIGAALAMLLWAYFLGRIIVSGAMLNAALWEQRQREQVAGSAPAGPEEHHDPGHDEPDH